LGRSFYLLSWGLYVFDKKGLFFFLEYVTLMFARFHGMPERVEATKINKCENKKSLHYWMTMWYIKKVAS
jgi:hypothetical protein